MAKIESLSLPIDQAVLVSTCDQHGVSLADLSATRQQLVVFLRHAGCTFCRQAVADIVRDAATIEAGGTGIVLVHMMTEAEAVPFFARYGAERFSRISDPSQALYRAFGLANGSVWQLLGPKNWWEGAKAFLGEGHGVGIPAGNVQQMPGSFLIHDGRILKAFRNETASDRPDYVTLGACETGACEVAATGIL